MNISHTNEDAPNIIKYYGNEMNEYRFILVFRW